MSVLASTMTQRRLISAVLRGRDISASASAENITLSSTVAYRVTGHNTGHVITWPVGVRIDSEPTFTDRV